MHQPNPHHRNYKSLKVRLYRIEQLLDKLSKKTRRRFKCKAKAFFKGLGGWWATTKEDTMAKKKKPKYKPKNKPKNKKY
jgi:HJR/Mrr/RecB family endonuclease